MNKLKKKIRKYIRKEWARPISSCLAFVFLFQFIFFPANVEAAGSDFSIGFLEIQKTEPQNRLPENPDRQLEVAKVYNITVTAYNAGVEAQTDDTPCTSANGENICEALRLGYKRCAANFVPFGTILNIDGYGQCLVTDRMNARYKYRVDIAMSADQIPEARKFGAKFLKVEVLK